MDRKDSETGLPVLTGLVVQVYVDSRSTAVGKSDVVSVGVGTGGSGAGGVKS